MSSPTAAPGDGPAGPAATRGHIEIVARFAPGATADAPHGTLAVAGGASVPFTGWLDLMAIVEAALRPGHQPGPPGPGPVR